MNESGDLGPEFATPAEAALHGRLEVVREDPPRGGAHLSNEVGRTLRWQALVIVPMTAALALAGGVADAVRALAGSRIR